MPVWGGGCLLEVTPNGGDCKYLNNAGLGVIMICPDVFVSSSCLVDVQDIEKRLFI